MGQGGYVSVVTKMRYELRRQYGPSILVVRIHGERYRCPICASLDKFLDHFGGAQIRGLGERVSR